MSEFIGSRISLVSKSDIRYVGTLHEINSETSTVALEDVISFGTEGRKGSPEEEIPPSDHVYEYIVFRGSDVKDLKIEKAAGVEEPKPPQMPNDPAILGAGARPGHATSQGPAQAAAPPAPQAPQQNQAPAPSPPRVPGAPARTTQQSQAPVQPPQIPQQYPGYPPYGVPFPPPPHWGRAGPMPGPGFPGMPPYGAPPPPGWFPPGPGFPPQGFPGPFPFGGFPPPPPGQQFPPQQKPAPIGAGANKQQAPGELSAEKPVESKAKPAEVKPATQSVSQGSTQAPTTAAPKESAGSVAPQTHSAPIAPKVGGVVPAMPLQSAGHGRPTPQAAAPNENAAPIVRPTAAASQAALDDATRAATAAVAAAMAKLPPIPGQQTNGTSAIDRVTQKVRELRTTEPVRAPRNPGATGFSGQRGRGGRGGHGGQGHESAKVVLPDTPFDFETANARFNKGDLVKEAIAGSPLESTTNGVQSPLEQELAVPKTASYNKASSFFDDLSSESKDRTEASERPGGRNWRGEEQKKNVETFGQGSVDNGYRGYRGRGRGRGGMRGRGSSGYGRGGPRGPRADAQTISQ